MFAAADFWLSRGVAGFRLDAINTLFEGASLADAPVVQGTNKYGEPAMSQVRHRNLPEVQDVLVDLRRHIDRMPGDRVLIGEIYTYSTPELARWYRMRGRPELQLPMNTYVGFMNNLDAAAFRKRLGEAEAGFGNGTPVYAFDTHDRPRSLDRYGDGRRLARQVCGSARPGGVPRPFYEHHLSNGDDGSAMGNKFLMFRVPIFVVCGAPYSERGRT